MGPFSMVVAIVFIAMIGRVMQERYRAMGRIADQGDTPHLRTTGDTAAQEEIRQLKLRDGDTIARIN